MVGAESGPVSVALSKRMRAIKKKLNKAEQIEQAVAAGKEINEDQTEVMKSKPSWVAVIDELGKLEGLLKDAVDEEIKIARQAWEEEAAAGRGKDTEAEERAAEQEQPQQPPAAAEESAQAGGKDSLQECLQEIIPLIYFSRVRARVPTPPAAPNRAPSLPSPSIPAALANWPARARCYPLPPPQMGDPAAHALSPRRPKQMFEKTAKDLLSIDPIEREMCIRQLTQNENVKEAERYACQSWVNQACADKLKEQDMDLIVQFGKLLTCRPAGQIISHEAAIEQCCSLAKKYLLQKSESLAEMAAPGQSAPTGSYLSEQLSKIMSSEYFTVKPVNSSINLDPPATPEQVVEGQVVGMQQPLLHQAQGGEPGPKPEAGMEPPSAGGGEAKAAEGSAPAAYGHPVSSPQMVPMSGHEQWAFGAIGLPHGPAAAAAAAVAASASMPQMHVMEPAQQQHMASHAMGQIAVTIGGHTEAMIPGQHLHYQQPGIPMSFAHPGAFMVPQHAGGMHPMMAPGPFPDPMYQGMAYVAQQNTSKADGSPAGQAAETGKGGADSSGPPSKEGAAAGGQDAPSEPPVAAAPGARGQQQPQANGGSSRGPARQQGDRGGRGGERNGGGRSRGRQEGRGGGGRGRRSNDSRGDGRGRGKQQQQQQQQQPPQASQAGGQGPPMI